MSTAHTTDVMLELHVPDFGPVHEFYEMLGFEQIRAESNYRVMKRGNNILCFYGGSESVSKHSYFGNFPADSQRGYGVEIIIPDDDVAALYERMKDKVKVVAPLQTRHWGKRDFRVEDPFGFYLRFTEK